MDITYDLDFRFLYLRSSPEYNFHFENPVFSVIQVNDHYENRKTVPRGFWYRYLLVYYQRNVQHINNRNETLSWTLKQENDAEDGFTCPWGRFNMATGHPFPTVTQLVLSTRGLE